MKNKKVLLYSGGLDSWLIDKLWKPDVKLHLKIGTMQNEIESSILPKDVIVKKIKLDEYVIDDGIVTIPLRNLIFLCLAVNYGNVICLGGTADDLHYDKTLGFIKDSENLFNSVLSKEKNDKDFSQNIKIVMPWKEKTKIQILKQYIDEGGDARSAYKSSFSCHFPKNKKECCECIACIKKINAFKEVGYDFS
jgi:7-cyano-7-deazaguanine synthase